MKTLTKLFILVQLFSWTVSFAQTGDVSVSKEGDTTTCYTTSELRQIATRVVRANECDTLLKIAELRIQYLDTAVTALQKQNQACDSVNLHLGNVIKLKEGQISNRDQEIIDLKSALKKSERKRKWLVVGWTSSVAVLTTILTISLLK
jgi:hypothetical protein